MEIRAVFKRNIFFLLFGAGISGTVPAQTLYNKDSKITVSSNTFISIKGSVENQGTIANNGHLKVGGPWVNSGTYHAGAGQVTFNSTSSTIPQIIHHNGQSFNRITISGGTKKIIISNIVVDKEISFDHGVVEAAGNSRIIFEPDVIISGASDRSHIHGVVYQKGTGTKLFPIGNGLIYLPVELLDIQDPSALIGVQGFEFENLALAKPASLRSISDKRYWYIDVASGALNNSQVVLPLREDSWEADPEKIVVAQSSSPTENFTSIGQAFFEGETVMGRVASEKKVTMPFVALATTAGEKELIVYNAVSANGDGRNDLLIIENIESYPENKFTLYSRWGDKIFEVERYDNLERAFRGRSNLRAQGELVSGTYFYVLERPDHETLRGFIAVKN